MRHVGGDRVVAQLARALEERSPRLWDWAPAMGGAVLGLEFPAWDGLGLLVASDLEPDATAICRS